MAQIEVILFSGEKIKIKLLDNPFIEDFLVHLDKMISTHDIVSHKTQYPLGVYGYDHKIVSNHVSKIVTCINKLNEMGLDFPVATDEVCFTGKKEDFAKERQLLNTLHRYFTTGHKTFSQNAGGELTWKFGSTYIFNQPSNGEEFSEYVHGINTAVHQIEPYTWYNERINEYLNSGNVHNEFVVSFIMRSEYALSDEGASYFKTIKHQHLRYHSDELKYDVWLPLHQIQGKDYITSYFDYDDPTEWDVTHPILYSGSFAFGDRAIMRDKNILNYFRLYGIELSPVHYGMPLGNVIEGKHLISTLGDFTRKRYLLNDVVQDIKIL